MSESHSRGDSNIPSSNIQVVLRIRPPTSSELNSRWRTVVQAKGNTAEVEQTQTASKNSASSVTFTFDKVIADEGSQEDVYKPVQPFISSFLSGRNCTVLALGQTSSGKSYTMGTDHVEGERQEEERSGIIQMAIRDIFLGIQERETDSCTVNLSYVEIYNEELIDLLVEGEMKERPIVQIREGKDGVIIFSGLREVKVTTIEEVMYHLGAGSSLRQTGSTSMNSQSSRSHAIFSLTLTQRRYTGTGLAPGNRSSKRPSGIFRPSSPAGAARASTPTNGRPGSALRPGSGSFGRVSSPLPSENGSVASDVESWVITTSKFHFVDLAGSERLKRTSAIGDRAKEGISINSGLLVLGNCISALGDPARLRQGITYVPYRESKLTRLLQDSLGGNCNTMLIACISSSESNVHETLSTLKYANRARNIKNEAKINESEHIDAEGMTKLISKLRGELAQLKEGGRDGSELNSIKEDNHQELQDNYSELTRKFAQLTADFTTVQASVNSSNMSREEFAIAVEPIVEEYEKSLSALESQLSLTKAALGHSEEEIRELELRLEEEEEVNIDNQEMVEQLKSRVGKLSEREATTEAYVRDLEGKLKDYGDQDDNHGGAILNLRKEIGKYRETADSNREYLVELEGRLERSEETNSALSRKIEVLEKDITRREAAYAELEKRLAMSSDRTIEQKELLVELDQREKQVLDLQRTMDELRVKYQATESESNRLQKLSEVELEEKMELQSRIKSLERASVSADYLKGLPPPSRAREHSAAAEVSDQLATLQARHDQTLMDLEIINKDHQAALKSIADLSAQVEEARENADLVQSPSASTFPRSVIASSTSTEDIHSLNSLAPSPTNSPSRSPRQRRSMPLSPQSRLSFLGARVQPSPISHGRSASLSLSQELSLVSGSPPYSTIVGLRSISPNRRESKDFSTGERSYEQMKNEVIVLQDALNAREEEITTLEKQVKVIRGVASISSLRSLAMSDDSMDTTGNAGYKTPPLHSNGEMDIDLSPKTRAAFETARSNLVDIDGEESAKLDALMRSMAQKESNHREAMETLEKDLLKLKRQHQDLTLLSKHQVVNMSSEITRLRLKLEEGPEKSIDGISQHDDVLNGMQESLDAKAYEIERLQQKGETDLENARISISEEYEQLAVATAVEHDRIINQFYQQQAQSLQTLIDERTQFLEDQRLEYSSALQSQSAQHASQLEERLVEHSVELEERSEALKLAHLRILQDQKATSQNEVEILATEHATTIDHLQQNHQATLDSLTNLHEGTVAQMIEDHAKAIREDTSRSIGSQHSADTSQISEKHELALQTLNDQHNSQISDMVDQHRQEHSTITTQLENELASAKSMHDELLSHHSALNQEHDNLTNRNAEMIQDLEVSLTEKEQFLDQKLKYENLLLNYKESFKKMDIDLNKTKEERDSLSGQLLRVSGNGQSGLGISTSDFARPFSPESRKETKMNAVSMAPTPPPAMPMPPPPSSISGINGTNVRTSSSSSMNWQPNESPGTSVRTTSAQIDPVVAKRFDEQESQIARLVKQLTHCESDLQANIDLVNTLESALNDSERNLRKARNQMNDLAKERDSAIVSNEDLKNQVRESQMEVETVRHSVVQVESRLQEERQGKERAKAELERRLDDVKRRKSKFSCL